MAGRGTALDLRSLGEAGCDGSPASPGRRAASETTGDGIGSAVSVLAPGRASGPTGICETSLRGSASLARAENHPENRPPRRPEHQSKHHAPEPRGREARCTAGAARQARRMTEVPDSECVAVTENRENMPPMIAADGGHSDRVFCFDPPPLRRLSSGRKSRQGVHGGNRTDGPTLFVQYPGPWEIVASWNVHQNGGEKVAAGAGRRCRPGWWTLLVQLRNFFQLQHSPQASPRE